MHRPIQEKGNAILMKDFFFVINEKSQKLLIITLKNEVGVFIKNKKKFEQVCTQFMASI